MDEPRRSSSRRPSGGGLPTARRSDVRRPSRPEFQMPDLPKEVQGGLGIVGQTGDLYVTCPAPTQKRVPSSGSRPNSKMRSAGSSPPLSARVGLPPLPSLPWSCRPATSDRSSTENKQSRESQEGKEDKPSPGGGATQQTAVQSLEGGRGSFGSAPSGLRAAQAPAALDALDDIQGGAPWAGPSPRLSPASEIKFKSLDSTLSKLGNDHDRANRLWHLAHDRLSVVSAMKSSGAGTAVEELGEEPCGLGKLGSSTGASDSTAATSCEGVEGYDADSTEPSAAAMGSSKSSWHPRGQLADAALTGNATAGNEGDASGQDPDGRQGTGEEERGRIARGRGTEAGDDADKSRGSTRRSTRKKTHGGGTNRSRRPSPDAEQAEDAKVSGQRSSAAEDEQDEVADLGRDVPDDLLDEFLQVLFARYSSTRDNRGRPLLNNVGVRKFLQDFSFGPGCKPSSAAVCRVVSQADVLYDDEIERQQNMSFVYDLSKGEAGRGLCFRAFGILLKQVKLTCSSKEMSRRWFVKYSVGLTHVTAEGVAEAMCMDLAAVKRA
eukprot:gb/GFBE01010669.1/.p1 GENE.gb/GFBE01010669.1/~~gb/GFBE01010669.1/.p1  ORF type:complete len:549 (+),score=104.84 gb/GFBE01010669.1/:1-1647(+)